MRKILFIIFVVFVTNSVAAQTHTLTFKFDDGKSYCTIEVDTTMVMNIGMYRALGYLDVPYYEMTFQPEFEYNESGEKILVITPTWHYHAYLAKVYGEAENADLNDEAFKLRFIMDPTGSGLTFDSSEAERRAVRHRSTFSKKGHIDMTEFPAEFVKADKVNWDKYPRDLRKNIQKRITKIIDRFNN